MDLPNVVYIAKYPETHTEITHHPCIPRKLPFQAITGMFWSDVRDKMKKIAEARLKKAEQELIAAQKHLLAVSALQEPEEIKDVAV